MADSDKDYDDDEEGPTVVNGAGPSSGSRGRTMVSRPKGRGQAAWEAAASSNWELQEAADGSIEGGLGALAEAEKRKRY